MVTPQTNTTLEEVARLLPAFHSFAICGHVNPDGDCIGSQLALAHALKRMGKQVTCLLAKPDSLPHNLAFLPGATDMVAGESFGEAVDCFVGVDVPTLERLEGAAQVVERATCVVTVDHHASEEPYAQHVYVDSDSPSASMLVWELIGHMGAKNADSALCAMTGLITDTGRFAQGNTTPGAFSAAADMMEHGADPAAICKQIFQSRRLQGLKLEQLMLEHMSIEQNGEFAWSWLTNDDFESTGAVKADAEPFVNVLRGIEGVRVALILKENEEGTVRGSLRAKDDTNVAVVAQSYDGGGHIAAAGFTFPGTMEQARQQIVERVHQMCFGQEA